MKKKFYCLIFFLFLANNCFQDFHFDNYKYGKIIEFYFNKCNINQDDLLKAFNDIPLIYNISGDELFLIDKGDFLILFLEFVCFYAYVGIIVGVLDEVKNNFKNKSIVDFCDKKISSLLKWTGQLNEGIYFNKMFEYINYKKNNKDVDGLIFSAYCFLSEFSKFL